MTLADAFTGLQAFPMPQAKKRHAQIRFLALRRCSRLPREDLPSCLFRTMGWQELRRHQVQSHDLQLSWIISPRRMICNDMATLDRNSKERWSGGIVSTGVASTKIQELCQNKRSPLPVSSSTTATTTCCCCCCCCCCCYKVGAQPTAVADQLLNYEPHICNAFWTLKLYFLSCPSHIE